MVAPRATAICLTPTAPPSSLPTCHGRKRTAAFLEHRQLSRHCQNPDAFAFFAGCAGAGTVRFFHNMRSRQGIVCLVTVCTLSLSLKVNYEYFTTALLCCLLERLPNCSDQNLLPCCLQVEWLPATLLNVPILVVDSLLYGTVVYFMIGLTATAAAYFTFVLVLFCFSLLCDNLYRYGVLTVHGRCRTADCTNS